MNTPTARQAALTISELIEFASAFQARYGKDYRLKPGSPAEAWELHHAILSRQRAMAGLLDVAALENPLQRLPAWWKWQETMDVGAATFIGQEVFHLLACCASFDAAPQDVPSPAILCSQRVIAGGLHPSALLVAQAGRERMQKAS